MAYMEYILPAVHLLAFATATALVHLESLSYLCCSLSLYISVPATNPFLIDEAKGLPVMVYRGCL